MCTVTFVYSDEMFYSGIPQRRVEVRYDYETQAPPSIRVGNYQLVSWYSYGGNSCSAGGWILVYSDKTYYAVWENVAGGYSVEEETQTQSEPTLPPIAQEQEVILPKSEEE